MEGQTSVSVEFHWFLPPPIWPIKERVQVSLAIGLIYLGSQSSRIITLKPLSKVGGVKPNGIPLV